VNTRFKKDRRMPKITLWLTQEETSFLRAQARSERVSVGKFVREIVLPPVKKEAENDKKARQILLKKVRLQLKKRNHDRYIILNSIRTILNIAKTNYLLGNDFNMTSVHAIVKDTLQLYKSIDPKVRKELREDIDFLVKLNHRENLHSLMSRIITSQRIGGVHHAKGHRTGIQ
jgi:hypothetical protein